MRQSWRKTVPEVDFHTGLTDKQSYACRLLRKAVHQGKAVVVTGDAVDLARLDQLLWTFDPGEFIAHARLRAGEAMSERLAPTPVWLADQPLAVASRDVLVNLGPRTVADAPAFARVVELVGRDEEDVQAGRARWRHYRSLGIEPRNHVQGT